MTTTITYHVGDVREILSTMADNSADLLVTSPPFLALRSYLPDDHPLKDREIGAEPTPAAFIDTLLGLTGDWRRVVADWGSIAVEIGDTYSGSGGAGGDYGDDGLRAGQPAFTGSAKRRKVGSREHRPEREGTGADGGDRVVPYNGGPGWPLAKSLCGIPTLYTWSLAYGRNLLTGTPSPAGQWRIRNLLTWTRPNPPVGALGDKVRPATSFVTVACVSDRRWFDLDAVRTEHKADPAKYSGNGYTKGAPMGVVGNESMPGNPAGAPPLDWWDANDLDPDELADWQPLHRLPTQPYKGSHYAAFPVALPRRLIDAMCPREVCAMCGEPRRRIVEHDRKIGRVSDGAGRSVAGQNGGPFAVDYEVTRTTLGWSDCGHGAYRTGIVLDPFGGSGTTAVAAAQAGRDAILIDLDWRNVDLTRQRITTAMHVHREVASHPVPRTDEEGRAGRTPVKGGHIRPIATRFTWHVDGARPAPAKPKPAPARQLSLAL